MNITGKVCLVTGGSRGIGAETAIALAAAGADVSITSRHNDSAAEKVRSAIEKLGRRSHFVAGDLRDASAAASCVRETQQALGDPSVLIHCAGGPVPGNILAVTQEAWYDAFDLHLHAAFHLCRLVIPNMLIEREGAIILVSSAAGLRGCPKSAAYSVVKGALPEFCRSLARDFGDSNIRVNCVAPGVIRTRFQDYLTPEQVHNNIENRIPLKREGTPRDVASMILTLVQNDFITGETVAIDGGMTMRIV